MNAPTPRSAYYEQSAPRMEYYIERLQAELDFAETLAERHKKKSPSWGKLVAEARKRAATAANAGGVAELTAAVDDVERILAPLSPAAKSHTVYCAGHAHIDMNWMWSWPETVAVVNDTFTTVLKLMDEFPQFHFTQSQASVYEIVEKHNPELLRRIVNRVKEGRWEIVASHWVEGDKNLAGEESLLRHLLSCRRYIGKIFGLTPEDVPIDWSPDTFGFPATTPTYLAKGGVRHMYLHRPGNFGEDRPEAFWWRGPDGSKVLVRNDMKRGYNGQLNPEFVMSTLKEFTAQTGLDFTLVVYGVGDHGGGPTRRDLLRGVDMNEWPIFPTIKLSTAEEFYRRLEKEGTKLPVIERELNCECTGCYTSQSLIKRCNRFGEARLADAETFSALAWTALRIPRRAEPLEEAWREILFSHFHDILPGSGVHDTRTFAHAGFQRAMATANSVETNTLRQLAAAIDTRFSGDTPTTEVKSSRIPAALGAGVGFGAPAHMLTQVEGTIGDGPRPIVVFNPSSFDRRETVTATIWDNTAGRTHDAFGRLGFTALSADGSRVNAQLVETGNYWGHNFAKLAFAATVPGYGYASYALVQGTESAAPEGVWQLGPEHHCAYMRQERSPEGLENKLVRIEIDPSTGGIRSLLDKRTGSKIVAPATPAAPLEYRVERPHSMTAWLIDHAGPVQEPTLVALTRRQKGPHIASLELKYKIKESDMTLVYELHADDPLLRIRIAGTWFQRGTPEIGVPTLSFALPVALREGACVCEIPFGSIERTNLPYPEHEIPALRWAMVRGLDGGKRRGCLLINDCKHGHSFIDGVLRLTLIRASYDPDPLPEIGAHLLELGVMPCGGDFSESDAIKAARVLTHPLRLVGTDIHKGKLPASGKFLSVSTGDAIVSGIKKHEEEDALVVHCFNPTGKKTELAVRLGPQANGTVSSCEEVDAMERPLAGSNTRKTGKTAQGSRAAAIPPRGIISLAATLKQ